MTGTAERQINTRMRALVVLKNRPGIAIILCMKCLTATNKHRKIFKNRQSCFARSS